jgi:Rod binding domain-containing protein
MDGIRKTAIPLVPKLATDSLHTPQAKSLKTQAAAAAGQFETMMMVQVVRSMESSLENGGLFGGGVAGDIYSGLTEWQLAQHLSRSGKLGVKEQILKQLPISKDEGK